MSLDSFHLNFLQMSPSRSNIKLNFKNTHSHLFTLCNIYICDLSDLLITLSQTKPNVDQHCNPLNMIYVYMYMNCEYTRHFCNPNVNKELNLPVVSVIWIDS